jgi:hypothetical protein
MSTPHSVHRDCWASLKWFGNPTFSQDFVHDHHLTWKVASHSTQGASLRFKQEGHVDTSEELKLWFPVDNQHIFARVGNDAIKLHFDNGINFINGYKFNFYGSLDFQKNWSRNSIKVGAQNISERCNSDNRLKIDEEYVQHRLIVDCDLGSQNKTQIG